LLLFSQRNDRIPVQADAAADAVVVGGEQVLKEAVIGGEEFALAIGRKRQVRDGIGMRKYQQVTLSERERMVEIDELSFSLQAYQMDAERG